MPGPSTSTGARARVATTLAAMAIGILPVAGCSDSGDDTAVAAARARVSVKENALESAESHASAAQSLFCSATTTYINALDRYGDVLHGTTPTVGDVRTAGADLAAPGAEAKNAAAAVVEAQDAVANAERELAEAEAALAAAEAAVSGTTPSPGPSTPAPSPTSTPVAVSRVQQAEAAFEAARAGITDQTPLRKATEQFNAAAVALEMAWLQLLGSSGCLSDDQQRQAEEAVAAATTTLQSALADAGYYEGEVDGIYGPETVDAIIALQNAHGLPQTGTMDKATEGALGQDLAAKGGAAAEAETASTAAVQQTLKLAGYWDGPVDGEWSDALTEALGQLQADLGVEVTGTVDAATVAALEETIEKAGATTSTPSPSASTTTSGG